MIPGNANPLLLASAAADDAAAGPIKSLRFNSGDSAHLSKTFSSAGNRKTWTWSGWIKRAKLGSAYERIFGGPASASHVYFVSDYLQFDLSNSLTGSASGSLKTSQIFRDPSAWYHIVAVCDTSQATNSNRMKLYVNGSQVTDFSQSTYPSQNYESLINSAGVHSIGYRTSSQGSAGIPYDGYMADIHFIDGSALDATSFGAYDDNGVWQAAAYSGTFGTNGFHLLDFANESTVGHDSSGNNNDFTANNISTTAGAGNDVLFDVPTNGTQSDTGAGGEVSGCYATLNPLATGGAASAPANGNLDFSSGSSYGSSLSTIAVSSGKWYWEITKTDSSNGLGVGVAEATVDYSTDFPRSSVGYAYIDQGKKANNNSYSNFGATWTNGDVIGIAFDADAGTLDFYKNGTSQGEAYSGLTNGPYVMAVGDTSGSNSVSCSVNFGQRAWVYSAPSNHKALCTTNLPTPTIADGSDYFEAKTYTGNGGTNAITGLEFSPSWVWIKSRANTGSAHFLSDVIRGGTKVLKSDSSDAEFTRSDHIQSFDSNGFTLGADGTSNLNNDSLVAWCWDAGSSTASNSNGTITSSVRASAASGFSIVSYTGNGTAGATIGHSLNAAPELILLKSRDTQTTNQSWTVHHKDVAATKNLILNSNVVEGTTGSWNDTAPGSSVFTVGSAQVVNTSGKKYIAYCFTSISGYSSVGSYTGSSSLPFAFTGFKPRFLLIKGSTVASGWIIYDTARDPFNVSDHRLQANTTGAESTNDANLNIDILSNGFKLRNTDSDSNGSSHTYVYLAIAENPFQANGGLAR